MRWDSVVDTEYAAVLWRVLIYQIIEAPVVWVCKSR